MKSIGTALLVHTFDCISGRQRVGDVLVVSHHCLADGVDLLAAGAHRRRLHVLALEH